MQNLYKNRELDIMPTNWWQPQCSCQCFESIGIGTGWANENVLRGTGNPMPASDVNLD